MDRNFDIIYKFNLNTSQLQTSVENVFSLGFDHISGWLLLYNASQIIIKCSVTYDTQSILNAQQVRQECISQTIRNITINAFSSNESSKSMLSAHHILYASFTLNGAELCVGFVDGIVLLRQHDNKWHVDTFVHIPRIEIIGFGAVRLQSINRLYFIYSEDTLVLINPENGQFKIIFSGSEIKAVVTSYIGTKLAVLLRSGECLVYDELQTFCSIASDPPKPLNNSCGLNQLQEKIAYTIPRSRLIKILHEFREFPQKYRPIMWKSLLKLPDNKAAFQMLINQLAHPCTHMYNKIFPIEDQDMALSLVRVVSCLAHWCPALAKSNAIPLFVFPFLFVFGSDLLSCFEAIATILLNYGQLWFEFAPLEPINYLGMVENVLSHVDPQLMKFYRSKNIPSSIYVWSLIESAFTDILTTEQWLSFWDHVLVQPPYFLVFCLVSLNTSLRNLIQQQISLLDVELLFSERIPFIDINNVIQLAINIMETCPPELHPGSYFHPFRSLESVQYQPRFSVPRKVVKSSVLNASSFGAEGKILRKVNAKLIELEIMKESIVRLFDDDLKLREHGQRLKMVENAYIDGIRCVELMAKVEQKQIETFNT